MRCCTGLLSSCWELPGARSAGADGMNTGIYPATARLLGPPPVGTGSPAPCMSLWAIEGRHWYIRSGAGTMVIVTTRPQSSHQRPGTDSGTADLGLTARQRPPVKRLRVFDVAHRGQLTVSNGKVPP